MKDTCAVMMSFSVAAWPEGKKPFWRLLLFLFAVDGRSERSKHQIHTATVTPCGGGVG